MVSQIPLTSLLFQTTVLFKVVMVFMAEVDDRTEMRCKG